MNAIIAYDTKLDETKMPKCLKMVGPNPTSCKRD